MVSATERNEDTAPPFQLVACEDRDVGGRALEEDRELLGQPVVVQPGWRRG